MILNYAGADLQSEVFGRKNSVYFADTYTWNIQESVYLLVDFYNQKKEAVYQQKITKLLINKYFKLFSI